MIKRHIERALKRFASSFPVVLVTGSRQTGKTTLLKSSAVTEGRPYTTFDDPKNSATAKNDPKTFMALHEAPCVFDEIQQAPQLFPYIKMSVDEKGRRGMYFLTGSQQFAMMQNVSESLAGRVGLLNLLPISLRERFGDSFDAPFVPSKKYILKRKPAALDKRRNTLSVWRIIQSGSYPGIVNGAVRPHDFYGPYLRTYIERDVRQLSQVADEMLFMQFVSVAAARTGQLVNYADMAKTVGVDAKTAKRWLSILETAGIVYLLPPYSRNVEKRIVKTPKLYFVDTGLAAYLTRWSTPEVLMSGAMAGNFFESFVVSEIIKSFANAGEEPPLYFYRDSDGVEVDLLIERDGMIYPIEIKATATPQKRDAHSFAAMQRGVTIPCAEPAIVCNTQSPGVPVKGVYSIPVWWI